MQTLAQAACALKEACTSGAPFVDSYNAVLEAGSLATDPEKDAAIEALLTAQVDHPEFAGYLSMGTGGLVQMGGSTRIGIDKILEDLARGAAVLADAGPALDEAELDEAVTPPKDLTQDERRWVAGFKLQVVGAMARLARDVECRKRARGCGPLDASIRALAARVSSNHVGFILEVLDMLDDEPLLVCDLPAQQVTVHRAFGVRSGFHLMTLLDGKDPFELVDTGVHSVVVEHGYFCWPAIVATEGAFTTADLGWHLWGEMRSMDLPRFEGRRAVLRTPKIFGSRSWDVSLVAPLHDYLRESLVTEQTLCQEASRLLLRRMVKAAQSGG